MDFSLFIFVTFMLIWFSGILVANIFSDKRNNNDVPVYHIVFTICLNIFAVYYIISLVGMTLDFCK